MRRIAFVVSGILLLAACKSLPPDDCSLTFNGKSRKLVKLRDPNQAGYEQLNKTVNELLQLGCELQPTLPATIPEDTALDAEKKDVTVSAFLMAVRYERTLVFQDRDFHIELSDNPGWNTSKHIIVEVPPGQTYCAARKRIWQLAKDDAGGSFRGDTHVFRNPPRIEVRGFLFFDGKHAQADCLDPGGRGIRGPTEPRKMVQGVWELHPVIEVH